MHDGAVLLHYHRRLARWLPPGGHVDPDELPDAAAVRETREEVGVEVEVVDAVSGEYWDDARSQGMPTRLPSPMGIQLEDIPSRPGNPAHQHIDLVYVAKVVAGASTMPTDVEGGSAPRWCKPDQWATLGLTPEVVSWAEAAIRIVGRAQRPGVRPQL